MTAKEPGVNEEEFWDLANDFLAQDGIEEGTLMGFRCLRVDGEFLATVERKTGNLIVKMDKDHVDALVESGDGLSFAPAGRVFKEWVAIDGYEENNWRTQIAKAIEVQRSKRLRLEES